jgi:N-acetylglucosaminyldiphosphoundecaprenol N-acetyl-beta-D-mannosaminyltransferase
MTVPIQPSVPLALPKPLPIADITVHPVTFEQTIDWVSVRAEDGTGGTVCTPNADYVVRAHRNRDFRHAIQATDLRVPDGMAIIYAARLARVPVRRTVTGRLLVPAIAERAAREGWPIALFGGREGVAADARIALQRRFPGLVVAAALSPPMGFLLNSGPDEMAVGRLEHCGARVIFVALGAPKQEQWMIAHRARLSRAVLVGVGAALDILAGRFREAPPWMTGIGLEWLFRLAQEPRRLARRYLVDDPWIFWWALRRRIDGQGATGPGR